MFAYYGSNKLLTYVRLGAYSFFKLSNVHYTCLCILQSHLFHWFFRLSAWKGFSRTLLNLISHSLSSLSMSRWPACFILYLYRSILKTFIQNENRLAAGLKLGKGFITKYWEIRSLTKIWYRFQPYHWKLLTNFFVTVQPLVGCDWGPCVGVPSRAWILCRAPILRISIYLSCLWRSRDSMV